MNKKIIIIEDDVDLLETVKVHLEKEGFKVLGGSTGIEVVNDIVNEKPGLILLDLNLPDLDGDIVAQVFQKKEIIEGVPIIIMSAKEESEIKSAVTKIRAVDYLKKPFDYNLLIQKVKANIK
ncbi:response regulator [Candidatus Dependentiae bacterium]|nr:response regulator [Candidatus Dependentiae bacterium]